jgi:hypothetical protein
MMKRSLVRPLARLVVALKDRSRSLEGCTYFCEVFIADALVPVIPVAVCRCCGERDVDLFDFVLFIFICFIIKN